jgi:hypothetical protein
VAIGNILGTLGTHWKCQWEPLLGTQREHGAYSNRNTKISPAPKQNKCSQVFDPTPPDIRLWLGSY